MWDIKGLEACWLTLNRVCNLRCYFCYARGTDYDVKKTMTLENAKKILSFCNSASIKNLVLIGGEPTLYPELFPLLEECAKGDFKIHLSTNGLRFKEESFCSNIFSIIKPSINISIKGHDSDSYFKTTSCDSFYDLLKAFQNLKKFGIDFHVSYVLTEDNIDYFLVGAEKAFEYGASSLHLSFAYDFSMSKEKNKDFLLKNNPFPKIQKFVEKIDNINRLTNGNWDFENGYPLCFYSKTQLDKIGSHLATGCQMLFGDGVLFDTDLNVIPCNSMYAIKLGQLGNHFNSYTEYREYYENEENKEIKEYLQSLPAIECMSCDKVTYCGGGCTLFWSQTSFDSAKKYINEYGQAFGVDRL